MRAIIQRVKSASVTVRHHHPFRRLCASNASVSRNSECYRGDTGWRRARLEKLRSVAQVDGQVVSSIGASVVLLALAPHAFDARLIYD